MQLLIVAFILTIFAFSACHKSATSDENKVTLHLPMTNVVEQTVAEQLSLPGTVFALPDKSVKVSAALAGKLRSVNIMPGQHVIRGEVIAVLDSRQAADQVKEAHAKVLEAIAAQSQANTNLLLSENTEARDEILVREGISAKKDLIAARSEVESKKDQLVAAKAQVNDAKAAEAAAQTQLGFTSIKSPITGVVAQRYLNVGDTADTNTPVALIVDLSKVVIEATMPTTQPQQTVIGQHATIEARALQDNKYVGVVQTINPVTDNQGTTIGVRISCDNPDLALKEGMPVIAVITTAVRPHALTIPKSALVSDPSNPDRRMVYVYKQGRISRVAVHLGPQHGARVEVSSGLNAGETIVAGGAYGIPDGTAVEAQSESLHSNSKISSKSY